MGLGEGIGVVGLLRVSFVSFDFVDCNEGVSSSVV